MIRVICIFFRPILASCLVSLTPREYQKNTSLSAFTPLAHCTPLFLLESFSLTLFLSVSFTWGVHTTICETEWKKEKEKERRKIRKGDKKREKTRYNKCENSKVEVWCRWERMNAPCSAAWYMQEGYKTETHNDFLSSHLPFFNSWRSTHSHDIYY